MRVHTTLESLLLRPKRHQLVGAIRIPARQSEHLQHVSRSPVAARSCAEALAFAHKLLRFLQMAAFVFLLISAPRTVRAARQTMLGTGGSWGQPCERCTDRPWDRTEKAGGANQRRLCRQQSRSRLPVSERQEARGISDLDSTRTELVFRCCGVGRDGGVVCGVRADCLPSTTIKTHHRAYMQSNRMLLATAS